MKDSLDKLIKKLVLPKYPIIKDYEITVDVYKPTLPLAGGKKKIASEHYTVSYDLSSDEDGNFTVTDDLGKIDKLTVTLFKMLGPEHYQKLNNVDFYSYKD
jgi:hypothetical protein